MISAPYSSTAENLSAVRRICAAGWQRLARGAGRALLAGAVLTETIFSWPGIGKWLIEAIGARDYPVVQNGILLIACLVILVNFTVDILYGLANPRIRHQK